MRTLEKQKSFNALLPKRPWKWDTEAHCLRDATGAIIVDASCEVGEELSQAAMEASALVAVSQDYPELIDWADRVRTLLCELLPDNQGVCGRRDVLEPKIRGLLAELES